MVGRGWQEGEGAQRERGQAWHEWGQGEREAAGGHRRRAEQDGEQTQDGRDQAQEAFEREEQERGVGIWRLGCGVYPGSVHFEYGECKAKESLGQGLVGGWG